MIDKGLIEVGDVTAAAINEEHQKAVGSAVNAIEHADRCGLMLTAKKKELPHGEFGKWVEEHCEFSSVQAWRYMKLAANIPRAKDLPAPQSIRAALQALSSKEDSESDPESPPESEFPEGGLLSGHGANVGEPAPQPPMSRTPSPSTPSDDDWPDESEEYDSDDDGDWPDECEGESPAPPQVPAPHVKNNSGNNEWYTPPEYIEAARQVMGGIDLDPATSEIAQKTVQAEMYYTKDDDGLSRTWPGRVWMNPPYSQPLIGQFAQKLTDEVLEGGVSKAIVLVNNATETRWFRVMAEHATAICFIAGRIKFLDATGNPVNTPLQGQAAIYIGNSREKFAESFSQFGFVMFSR